MEEVTKLTLLFVLPLVGIVLIISGVVIFKLVSKAKKKKENEK